MGPAASRGGPATSSLTITGAGSLTANDFAYGGAGRTGNGSVTTGAGGGATATDTAVAAKSVNASATAQSGTGGATTGAASATVTATGTSGLFEAAANSNSTIRPADRSFTAGTSGDVNGTSKGSRWQVAGGRAGVRHRHRRRLRSTGAHQHHDQRVLAANSAIKTKFGASRLVFFAVGELGGGHSSAGATTRTTSSTITEQVDLTKLGSGKDLVVGLYDGAFTGSGFTSITFDLVVNGVDVVHDVFTSVAAARTFFTDHAMDLGPLGAPA